MRKKIRREFTHLHDKLNDTFDLPDVGLSAAAQIELSGNREAVVDGCQGILQYEDTVIRLSTGRLIIRFTGNDLMIRTMQQNQILITGTILSMDFLS